MRYLIFILFLTCTCIVKAQEGGFLYIETEPSRPFFLRTRDSLINSSEGNYIILAPLGPHKGDIILGFPGGRRGILSFSLSDTTAERGLVLRELPGSGWRLFDRQLQEQVTVRRLSREEDDLAGLERRSDAFALRLSQVMNDSSLLYFKRPVPVVPDTPVAAGSIEDEQLPVRLIDRKALKGKWRLRYEVKEEEGVDTVTIEIPRKVPAKKAPAQRKQPGISANRGGTVLSQHDQVFYRSGVPRRRLCGLPAAGERAYCTG